MPKFAILRSQKDNDIMKLPTSCIFYCRTRCPLRIYYRAWARADIFNLKFTPAASTRGDGRNRLPSFRTLSKTVFATL